MHSIVLLVIALVAGAGCADIVGVKHVTPQQARQQVTRNALTADAPSDVTQIVLRRHNLAETFDKDPAAALAALRQVLVSGRGGNDELFALAELSYLYGRSAPSQADALAAAVYAYAFLFPNDPTLRPAAIDPRYRVACDLYAEALTQALEEPNSDSLVLKPGTYSLPFGSLVMTFDTAALRWGSRTLTDFVPVGDYEIHGMRNRYRQPGIGVPVAAKTRPLDTTAPKDFVGAHVRVPATVVLRLDDPRQQIIGDALYGSLELYASTDRDEVAIDGQEVPLEVDRTASLAVTLAESAFWNQELSSFLGNAVGIRKTAHLVLSEPYRPGRIPVVFVHGTNSSPGRWADMENDLLSDARIRQRFQFWFFTYDSGNPIAYSAMLLRRALRDAVARFDPDGHDACLRQMVVIGHSQGGLLTKMTAMDSGPAFWDNISGMPFDEVRLSEESRATLQETLFIKPLPFVSRVVFISTPHRGSYLAGFGIVQRLAAKFISLPRDLTAVGTDLIAVRDPAKRMATLERFPTSIDNMSPGNPFIKTLASIPVSPDVAAHSIIPVQGDGPLEDQVDGVVAYKSAHIEGVESERVIRPSSHSTQSNPETVDEVRRILLLQAHMHACSVAPPADTSPMQPPAP